MDKKITIIAIAVAAIVLVGIIAVAFMGGNSDDEKVVYWVEVAPINQKAQLEAGIIDGAITWEPYASDAYLDGTASIYKWSDQIWSDHPCCVMVVDQDYLAENENIVLRVLKAHQVATDWILDSLQNPDGENYTKLLDIGAEFSQRNTSVVASSLDHMQLTYEITDEFEGWMKTITEKYINLTLIANGTLATRGYDDVDDFIDNYVDSSLQAQAADVEPSTTILNPDDPVRLGYLLGDLHQFARVVAANDTLWGEDKDLFEVYGVATVTSTGGPYAAGGPEMDAFASGLVDIGYLGSPPAILKHLNGGVNTLIISQVNTVGSAIFVDPSITSLDDFNGKTIGTPGPSSIQHLMFLDYFTSNGFVVKAK
ncbi:MAG TPA: ABC transporter substrate-binding protein [Methanomassiliicoccales archaeon]|nr:ABC transporter substrate-binding protein [Methanomassiliicoccales archaeon]